MRKSAVLGLFLLAACLFPGTANAATCPPPQWQQFNGQTVIANFNSLFNCINGTFGGGAAGSILTSNGPTVAPIWQKPLGISVTSPPYNAVCDDVADDSVAFVTWFTALAAGGLSGVLPAATCKISAQVYWNITNAASAGVTIRGQGKQISILHLTTSSSPAMLIGGNPGNYFYSSFRDFGIKCNLGGVCLQFAHEDYSDPENVFETDLWVGNASMSSSAVAVELNYYLNSPETNIVANVTAGHGDALKLNQAVFDNFFGSFSTANIGVHYANGYSYGNVFHAADIENVVTDVQSDSANASQQLFVGGEFVWSGANPIVMNAGNNNFRFVGAQFASGAASCSGAKCAVVQVDNTTIGTYNFGAINIFSPAGADAVLNELAPTGQNSGLLFSLNNGGTNPPLWQIVTAAAGGPLNVTRFSGGVSVDNPMSIDKITGVVTLVDGLAIAGGGVTINGGGLTVNSGNVAIANTITGGTWHGSVIQPAYGGTGRTDLTFSTAGDVTAQGNSTTGTGGVLVEQGAPSISNPTLTAISSSAAALAYLCYNTGTGAITFDSAGTCLVSSLRLKANAHPLRNNLAVIDGIDPIGFEFKDQSTIRGPQEGVSAESVARVDPDLVEFDRAGLPLKVKYQELLGRVIGAIQEQQREIMGLREGRR
jgi:hypothetical protein